MVATLSVRSAPLGVSAAEAAAAPKLAMCREFDLAAALTCESSEPRTPMMACTRTPGWVVTGTPGLRMCGHASTRAPL